MNEKFRLVEFKIKDDHIPDFKKFILKKKKAKEAHGAEPINVFECTNKVGMFFVMSPAPAENNEENKLHMTNKLEDMFSEPINKMELKVQAPGLQTDIKTDFDIEQAIEIFFIFRYVIDYKDDLIKAFDIHVTKTREERDNILFDFFTVENQENVMVVHEYWKSEEALWNIHMNLPHSKEIEGLMNKALIGNMKDDLYYIKPLN